MRVLNSINCTTLIIFIAVTAVMCPHIILLLTELVLS